MTFSGKSYSTTGSTGATYLEKDGTASITVGAAVDVTFAGAAVKAGKVDFTISSFNMTVTDAATVELVNGFGFCGLTDWVLNVKKPLIDNAECGIPAAERTDKDIAYMDEAATPDRLYYGAETAALDADGYPTVLDETYYEERQ